MKRLISTQQLDRRIWGRKGGGWADRAKMGKGVTLSKEELLALKELLNKIEP
ncbi:MAG: hypothetical protein WCC12_03135 [Anaerolineales bacterium]